VTSLAQFYKGTEGEKDGGWGKLNGIIKGGRKVAREERLRWQENREFYRGNQGIFFNPGENYLRGNVSNRADRVDNSFNRLRQFLDGRTALLTKERPPYEVSPENFDSDSIDAAKQAEKFIASRWGHNGWNIKSRLSELATNGDIDGLAWLSVMWDSYAGSSRDQLVAIDNATGQPITDPALFEAMRNEDPMAQVKWSITRSPRPMGDVAWRVVLPGAISVDPFAVKDPKAAKWVCESRIRPRSEVEERLKMSFKEAVKQSADYSRERTADPQYEDIALDDGTGKTTINEADGVVVHYFFAIPCHEFPKGLHVEFCDKAPAKPMVLEPWEGELPYFAYVPRPDPGHFIRSKGMADDLKPIQRDYNEKRSDLREWLRRVARTPVAIPFGSMASDSYYNKEGVFFFHPQMGEPHHAQVPSEPTAVITNELAGLVAEMRDISGVSASAQGLRAPGGPEAAVGINLEIQQTENNLSQVEAQLVEAIEWGVGRSLKLVEKHYQAFRMAAGVGVDDSVEFSAFQGALMRGAHRFRINGPLMPKSKAARMAAIQQLVPLLGDKIFPHIGGLIDGDPTELTRDIELDRSLEKGAVRELLALGSDEKALVVYKNFEDDKQAFTQAFNLVTQSGSQNPMGDLAAQGIMPPRLTESLKMAGFDVPLVEDFHNHAMCLKALDEFRKADAYRKIHEMGKQLLRERAEAHKQGISQQVMAMAQQMPAGQQGSAPKEVGTPSAPKNTPPQPGGMQ
jgi:hypothetical protein